MLKIAAYHSPTTLLEAASLLAEDGRTAIAGGTDLPINPRYMVGVREVVDIRRLGLNYIHVEDGWLHIGAGATMRTIAQRGEPQSLANGIPARGAAVCGSPNIRNMATLARNVSSPLPSADTPPALLMFDAEVVLVGTQGERVVPLNSFFEAGETLLEALHAHHLKGTKLICGTGDCCSYGVLLNSNSINACWRLRPKVAICSPLRGWRRMGNFTLFRRHLLSVATARPALLCAPMLSCSSILILMRQRYERH